MKTTTFFATLLVASIDFAHVPNYVPTTGLVGWWPFNGNANDVSENSNNGIVTGALFKNNINSNLIKTYNL
jgi:hypothetical protein